MHSMSISFFSDFEKRFFFLCGRTDDEFCTQSLALLNIEEILYQHLKNDLNYKRILYFNGRQKLYFYDQMSMDLCRQNPSRSQGTAGSQRPSGKKRSGMCGGPLKMRKIKRSTQSDIQSSPHPAAQNQPANETEGRLNYCKIKDTGMVGIMSVCMMDPQIKTAIVFSEGLDFIAHTETEAHRQMALNLTGWSREFSTNENICIFIMPDMDAENLRGLFSRYFQWQFLQAKMFGQNNQPCANVIQIGSPHQDEVMNMFNYTRLKNGLQTDWNMLSHTTISITRNLRANGETLKSLGAKLKGLNSLNATSQTYLCGNAEQEPAIERLKKMRGLGVVVQRLDQFIELQKEMEEETQTISAGRNENTNVARFQPPVPKPGKKHNLHLVLKGNPGTGKTTVANLIGEIFRESGLLELGHLVKASREDLVAGYVGQTALNTAEKISDAMGGILFVDEAYRLSEGGENDFGKEALETIMEAMSNHMGEFSVIIAGYTDKIDGFMDTNQGLRRRFGPQNEIVIPDYEPSVLMAIFEEVVSNNNKHLDTGFQQILSDFITNWYDARDPATFGNAGDVINLYEALDANRANRVVGMEYTREQKNTLTLDDIPQQMKKFVKPKKVATVEEALSLLDGLTGIKYVKSWLKEFTQLIQVQQEQQKRGLKVHPPFPGHYLFLGNPGTGKTTVARILGNIFSLLGFLGKTDVIEVGPSELIDKHVGGTEEKARKVFNKAINGVLFIDEAHKLADCQSYGQNVIRELVPFMLNNRENLCVIAAGYQDDMENFLAVDSGLKSRFTKQIMFEDFDEAELFEIFETVVKKNDEIMGPGLADEIKRLFTIWVLDKDKDFGNARDVNNLIDSMREGRAGRLASQDITQCSDADMQTFLVQDIPAKEQIRIGKKVENLDDILDGLNSLIGLTTMKEMIRTIINRLKIEKLRGGDTILAPGHYLFVGNPGTGKTTVARKMGEIFRSLGLLKKGHLVEVGRPDLVGGYQGQTALKTTEVLTSSLDGILFIDEAYQLVNSDQDSYGQEALETLLAFMENHRDRLCILAAGYPEPMQEFVAQNPGFPSRFSGKIVFENYNAQEMLDIFMLMAKDNNMKLGQGVAKSLRHIFLNMEQTAGPTFGNGRDVRKLFDTLCANQSNRLATSSGNLSNDDKEILHRLETEDIPENY